VNQLQCDHSGIRGHKGGAKKRKKVSMPNKIRALAQSPLWIITCYRNNRMEVLTIDPDGDAGGVSSLPVFSFEEEAKTFLCLSEDDQEGRRWRCRQTTAGELASVLLGPGAEVRQVTLDPLPLSLGRAMLPYISVARERFVEYLLGGRRELGGELLPA
jgi:hypothetical protein